MPINTKNYTALSVDDAHSDCWMRSHTICYILLTDIMCPVALSLSATRYWTALWEKWTHTLNICCKWGQPCWHLIYVNLPWEWGVCVCIVCVEDRRNDPSERYSPPVITFAPWRVRYLSDRDVTVCGLLYYFLRIYYQFFPDKNTLCL